MFISKDWRFISKDLFLKIGGIIFTIHPLPPHTHRISAIDLIKTTNRSFHTHNDGTTAGTNPKRISPRRHRSTRAGLRLHFNLTS